MTPTRRASIFALSLILVATGLGWDAVRSNSDGRFGPLQAGVCLIGAVGVLFAALHPSARVYLARGVLLFVSCYGSAFVVDRILAPPIARWGRVVASQRGMVQPSSWGGYELTPGWHGRYDDGWVLADVDINAQGDRDDLPSEHDLSAPARVLLLGDSFAFGWGLAKDDTIEHQIESASNGRAIAYNLGVGGYGPADTLEHYRERAAFPATHTLFLLYGNDLRIDNCTAGFSTAVDGVIVPRPKDGDPPHTPQDVERVLAAAIQGDEDLWLKNLKSSLFLKELRGRWSHIIRRNEALATGMPEQYPARCAVAAAARADEMREIARARGGRFAVVVIPTPGEVQLDTYHPSMQTCLRELARRSIEVVEVRDRLEASAFFSHHEHLNPSGAHEVAVTILAALDSFDPPSRDRRGDEIR